MYDLTLTKPRITPVADGYRVSVTELDKVIWEAPVIHLDRSGALGLVEDITDAFRNALCGVCGSILPDFIDAIGSLETDANDFRAYCTEMCRDEAEIEEEALRRAGL